MGAQTDSILRAGKRRKNSYRPMSEINVTPFVDVMLVLLVVFMITAPLLTAGIPIDLPDSKAKALTEQDNKPLELTITVENKIFIGETEVEPERLIALLTAMTRNDPDRRIFVRGDKGLEYGEIIAVLGSLNKAGFRKVALISEPVR
jgi:biopolymer transport protein TolR